ncbi:MAG: hypothetical protein CBE00_14245 [Planctomycetaceae bacterium TMED240]|nr:transposase [Rhodopirellula sp.]OUX03578.1 MAG: hypothetical protein CBE00_14245 [Planctomycetaceae bacterium TMED240]
MLISRKCKFLFVHVYKNAGMSITKALSPFTVSRYQRETVRLLRQLNLPFPIHWDPTPFDTHATAVELVSVMGRDEFASLFSFGIVRNPWDWLVSLYTYVLKTPHHHLHPLFQELGSFQNYIGWQCDGGLPLQKDFLFSSDGEQLVSFIGRYEKLERDFRHVCTQVGVSANLPKLNVSRKSRSFKQYYDERLVEMVREKYQPDIDLFDYRF